MKLNSLIAGIFAAGVLLGGTRAVQAEPTGPIVVELYTSQGCSSCPPADELLHQLAERADVLPLALHVDYWDYIGWADSFARPEHTKRQKAYAHVAGSRTIYTPQMVVGGVQQIVGARPMEVADAIMEHMKVGQPVRLTASRQGDTVAVSAPALGEPRQLYIQLVRFTPEQTVMIERGENAGKTMVYANVVREWKVLAEWSGAEPLALEIPADGEGESAVIVQAKGPGPILGALRLP